MSAGARLACSRVVVAGAALLVERAPAIALAVVQAALARQALEALCLKRSGAARWPVYAASDGVRWPFKSRSPACASGRKTLAGFLNESFPSHVPSLGAIRRDRRHPADQSPHGETVKGPES